MTQTLRSGLWGVVLGVALLGAVRASEATFGGASPPGASANAELGSPAPADLSELIESIEDSARWNMEERTVFKCEMTEPALWICGYGRELVPRQRK